MKLHNWVALYGVLFLFLSPSAFAQIAPNPKINVNTRPPENLGEGVLVGEVKKTFEALRQAQIEMWKQKDWRSPYYWAAFQMQGEWK